MSKLTKETLERQLEGDSWPGITVGPVLVDGVAPASNAASAKMEFRDEYGTLAHTFNSAVVSGQGLITIDDAATWEFSILKQAIGLEADGLKSKKYNWDFEVTDAAGDVLTLAAGTIKIDPDVTE